VDGGRWGEEEVRKRERNLHPPHTPQDDAPSTCSCAARMRDPCELQQWGAQRQPRVHSAPCVGITISMLDKDHLQACNGRGRISLCAEGNGGSFQPP